MFIKKVTNKKGNKTYLTYRLVKSKRIKGKSRHINILELGSLSNIPLEKHKELGNKIEDFINGESLFFKEPDNETEEWASYFYKKFIEKQLSKTQSDKKSSNPDYETVDLNSLECIESKEIGGEWLCSQAIEQLELSNFISEELGWNQNQVSVSMLALLGRLLYPASELKTAKWLNENSAALELYSPKSGSIDRNRLQQGAVMLYKEREKIEAYLSNKISDIYQITSKYILYDLTNTHFEGKMKLYPNATFGRNKQKRNDCPQVTLGLITDENGFCKKSRFYEGNVSEPSTFCNVVTDAKANVKQTRPVIIMDAGISSMPNLKRSLSEDCDYICVSKGAHKDIREKLDMENLISFTNKAGDEIRTQKFTQTIEYEKEGKKIKHDETILYVETDAKKGKEQGMFEKKRQRFEKGLEGIKTSLSKPRGNKKTEKIYERIGRLKEKYPGIAAAYEIKIREDKEKSIVEELTYDYDENNAKLEKSGSYFIRTSILAEDEELLWKLYRTIGEIENTFRILKSDLNMRPVHHQKGENIEAHLNLAVLSYFIVSFIRYKLKSKGIRYCWNEIVRIMNTQKCNINTIINKQKMKIIIKICTRPTLKTSRIYKAMNYKSVPFYRKKKYLDI
ncbi:MAG: IS1634 family transposase [Desulfobacterales bacterium]|nr:IS1634 family transposase [Desulfobacterales bacterium]